MAAPISGNLATAAGQGDLMTVNALLQNGCDVNERSKDGMTPLSIAAFWGYADIAKVLLDNGASVNAQNSGTKWTPLHCAAFQGHGPVVMRLMMHNPDLEVIDAKSRTAADFASALDSIWPFFADAGCKRTSKQKLIEMDIIHKVSYPEGGFFREELAHYSRLGSSYSMRSQMGVPYSDPNMEVAAITGDVLASMPEEPDMMTSNLNNPSLISLGNNGY